MAAIAIFHSKRQAMYIETNKKNTSRARIALMVMLRPQEELTLETLTSATSTFAVSASDF